MPGVEVLRDLSDAFVEGGRRRRLSRPAARTHVLTCNIVFAGAIAFPPDAPDLVASQQLIANLSDGVARRETQLAGGTSLGRRG